MSGPMETLISDVQRGIGPLTTRGEKDELLVRCLYALQEAEMEPKRKRRSDAGLPRPVKPQTESDQEAGK